MKQHKTVALLLLVAALVQLGACGGGKKKSAEQSVSSAGTYINASVEPSQARPGETLTLELRSAEIKAVASFDIYVEYDPEALTVTDGAAGEVGEFTILNGAMGKITPGRVKLSGMHQTAGDLNNDFLGSFTFTVNEGASGSTTLTVKIRSLNIAKDANGNETEDLAEQQEMELPVTVTVA